MSRQEKFRLHLLWLLSLPVVYLEIVALLFYQWIVLTALVIGHAVVTVTVGRHRTLHGQSSWPVVFGVATSVVCACLALFIYESFR